MGGFSKFYAIKGSVTSSQTAFFGPFYPNDPLSPTAAQRNLGAAVGFGQNGLARAYAGGARAKFPGVYSPPQPSRGWFQVAAAAGITNHSTFTLNDGSNPAVVFEFLKSGSPVGSDVPITATAGLTDVQIAANTVAAINTQTGVMSDVQGGWLAQTFSPNNDGVLNGVLLVQTGGPLTPGAFRAFWVGVTYGVLGNNAIIDAGGTGITGLVGMSGGTVGGAGVPAQFVNPGRLWATTLGGYIALPK